MLCNADTICVSVALHIAHCMLFTRYLDDKLLLGIEAKSMDKLTGALIPEVTIV